MERFFLFPARFYVYKIYFRVCVVCELVCALSNNNNKNNDNITKQHVNNNNNNEKPKKIPMPKATDSHLTLKEQLHIQQQQKHLQQQQKQQNQQQQQHDTDRKLNRTIIFMDSNRKILDTELLWKHSTMVECGNIPTLLNKIKSVPIDEYDIVVIHVGVNDIDSKDGPSVADDLLTALDNIRSKAPNIKIVLSEVTPRQHTRDDEVIECNKQLKTYASSFNVTFVEHSNLRSPEMFRNKNDDKHFCKNKAGLLASNIKRGLRRTIGLNEQNSNSERVSSGRNTKPRNTNINDFKKQLINFLKSM